MASHATANSMTSALDDSEFVILTPQDLAPILADHAEAGEPILILGDPGGGKSELVGAAARAVGKPMTVTNLALSDGTDLKGLPYRDHDSSSVTWVKDKNWLNAAMNPTTQFLDELPQAPVLTQCAAAPIILEKRNDDLFLHPDTWVVAAGNFPKNKAGTNRIPSHIPNRVTTVALAYHAESQVNYLLQQPEDTVDLLTMRFLRMKGDTAFFFDPANTVNATPRQWSWVARRLASNPGTPFATIAGRIGKGNASELMSFRDLAPLLPSPEEILLAPKAARVPDNTSAQFLITDLLADQCSVNTFDALVEYAKRLPPEMQGKFCKDAVTRKPEVMSTRAFVDWGVKFAEVLR